MRKIVAQTTGGPEVLELVEVPDPVPGPGEVLLRNHTVSVAGPDILIRSGRYRFMPTFPHTVGNESSCTVEALGPGVEGLSVGQPVYLSWRALPYDNPGFYTELMVAPAESVMPLPQQFDLELAASLGPYTGAWAMLREAPAGRTMKSALIVGSAGVYGSALLQIARYSGISAIGLVSSPEKAAFAQENGATHTINYRTEPIKERVLELTDGKGVDVIVDHLGGPNFTDYFDMLDHWGVIVSINGVDGSPRHDTFEEGRNHSKKCVSICFFAMYAFQADQERRKQLYASVTPLLVDGTFKPKVAARFPLEQAADAHRLFESGTALGRIFLKP